MKTIEVQGYTFIRKQSEGIYRLQQINRNSAKYTLEHWYKNPSIFKQSAYEDCVIMARELEAQCYTICSASVHRFTFGFYTIDPENGNINRVYWLTGCGAYYADI